MKKEVILVTGFAGFIGKRLCRKLLNQGHTVIGIDNMETGDPGVSRILCKYGDFTPIYANITNPIDLPRVFVKTEPTQIYNLACPASPQHYQKAPVSTIKTNTLGVLNVLQYATRIGARILQASTSEIYGEPLEHPQKESYNGNVNPIGPRACYNEGKRIAETMCSAFRKSYSTDVRIARIFNTYGPGMRFNDGRVMINFIKQAIQDKPITIYGSGSQTRSFCYISDTVDALIKIMNAEDPSPVINVGNPHEISVEALAWLIKKHAESDSSIIREDALEDDPSRRKPDITLLQELGWRPNVSLQGGITHMINTVRENYDI